jgi:hypothetical protein
MIVGQVLVVLVTPLYFELRRVDDLTLPDDVDVQVKKTKKSLKASDHTRVIVTQQWNSGNSNKREIIHPATYTETKVLDLAITPPKLFTCNGHSHAYLCLERSLRVSTVSLRN